MSEAFQIVHLSERDRALIVACAVALIDAQALIASMGAGNAVEMFSRFRVGLEDRLQAAGGPAAPAADRS